MNGRFIKFSLSIFLFLAMGLWGSPVEAAMETTVEEIMANRDSYDGKEVMVYGAVSTPRFKSSRHGKPYMTLPLLGDSKGRINVLFWGNMKLKTGKKVRVTGIYRKIMEMGKYTFRDVIEASEIETEIRIQDKNP
jgi:hypothetical protein